VIFDGVVNIVLLLVILVALVVLHEFGHFAMARAAGVRVHEFGIGFPPRARILHRGKDTVYTLNWLPIGGFVRLEGEEGQSEDPRAFSNQRLRTRTVILLAGVVMNFLFAWLIFSLIAGLADPVANIRVASVQAKSPAEAAGLVGGVPVDTSADGTPIYDDSGDVIIAIDGRRFAVFSDMLADPPLAYLRAHAGQQVVLTVRHLDGTVTDVPVTLRAPDEAAAHGALGIGIQGAIPTEDIQRGPLEAVSIGFQRTVDASTLILRGLQDLVRNLSDPQVQGPVGMVDTVGAFRTQLPPVYLLWLIGVLSANLAIVNALPLPPLDGGRVLMAFVGRLFGKRLTPQLERNVYLAGWVGLMAFLVWITMFDVRRLAGG
jgi:regulator of sigma E protease